MKVQLVRRQAAQANPRVELAWNTLIVDQGGMGPSVDRGQQPREAFLGASIAHASVMPGSGALVSLRPPLRALVQPSPP